MQATLKQLARLTREEGDGSEVIIADVDIQAEARSRAAAKRERNVRVQRPGIDHNEVIDALVALGAKEIKVTKRSLDAIGIGHAVVSPSSPTDAIAAFSTIPAAASERRLGTHPPRS
jgi:hypothetical protein